MMLRFLRNFIFKVLCLLVYSLSRLLGFLVLSVFTCMYILVRLESTWHLFDRSDCKSNDCLNEIGQHIKYGMMVSLAYDMLQDNKNSINYLENILGNNCFIKQLVECVTPGYEFKDDLIAFPHSTLARTDDGSYFGYIAANTETHDIAVVLRGTVTHHDWGMNFNFGGNVYEFDGKDIEIATSTWHNLYGWSTFLYNLLILPITQRKQVILHAGFYNLYRTSTEKATESLKFQIRKHIEDLLARRGVFKTITITGHSLGAGISTIAALDTAHFLSRNELYNQIEIRLVTFAAPLVGNRMLWKELEELRVSRFEYFNIGDCVPWLQTGLYSHGNASRRLRLKPSYDHIKDEEKNFISVSLLCVILHRNHFSLL